MAIEVFPDSPSLGMSPRISFSHDLAQNDVVPVEQYVRSSSTSSSNIDFDFCVFRQTFETESSSADELFFDGKILPIEIKKRLNPPQKPPLPPQLPILDKKSPNLETEEKQGTPKSTSFWRFKRSSSCGSGYGRTLCPLPLLSRSNSTGSTASGGKKSSNNSNSQKQSYVKYSVPNSSLKAQTQQSQSGYSSTRPPLKKSHGLYGNGVKFNPVLNVPPANLFGLGSIFSSGKEKSRKK